jgi:hypothetical protein
MRPPTIDPAGYTPEELLRRRKRVQQRPKKGKRVDRDAWHAQRQRVIARAGGRCERCHQAKGEHVHHFYYPDVIGHEPSLTWLQLVCLPCHTHYHPRYTFRTVAEQKRIAAERKRKAIAKAKARDKAKANPTGCRITCAHCGGQYSRRKHRDICVKFGLVVRARD